MLVKKSEKKKVIQVEKPPQEKQPEIPPIYQRILLTEKEKAEVAMLNKLLL
jgi:hypothetical protein